MTRTQRNNQSSGGIAAHPTPKNSEFKNPLEMFLPRFLGSRRQPPHWLCSKRPKHQHGVLLIPVGASEGHLEGQRTREGNEDSFVFAQKCPASSCTCSPKETGLHGLPMS
jgi:hypothetical protein